MYSELAGGFSPTAVFLGEASPPLVLPSEPLVETAAPELPPPTAGGGKIALLGGAPANFAVMAGQLGNHAAILSRIGRDDPGRRATARLSELPVDTSYLDVDPAHETGRVTVSFESHEPCYVIHQPAAWDFLELKDEWVRAAERADAICFGTLAQRSAASRRTIQALAAATRAGCIRVFDVNLRAPYYSGEVMQESLGLATVVKMNEHELPPVLRMLGLGFGDEDAGPAAAPEPAQKPGRELGRKPGRELGRELDPSRQRAGAMRLLDEFPALEMVAITRGSHGSLLVTREKWNEHPGVPVKAADSIGAGDAFAAALVHYMLRGADLATLNKAANRWGAWVASQPGAMPALPDGARASIEAALRG